jgi:hypothetical protein
MSAYLVGLPKRYLRTPEAARFVGLSIRTLEKHRIYRTGPRYSKLGGRDGRTETLAVSPRPQARRPPTWRLAVRLSPSPRQVGKTSRRSSASHSRCATSRASSPCRATALGRMGERRGRVASVRARPVTHSGLWTICRTARAFGYQWARAIRNRKTDFPQAVQSLPSRLT